MKLIDKAAERALERFPVHKGASKEWIESHLKGICSDYIEGYHQAEKDLSLTVEDIEKIDNLLWDLSSKWSDKNDNAGYFQDVLNRFNKQKEK